MSSTLCEKCGVEYINHDCPVCELKKRVAALEGRTPRLPTMQELGEVERRVDALETQLALLGQPAPEVRTGMGEPSDGTATESWEHAEWRKGKPAPQPGEIDYQCDYKPECPYANGPIANLFASTAKPAPQPGEPRKCPGTVKDCPSTAVLEDIKMALDKPWDSRGYIEWARELRAAYDKPAPITPAQVEEVVRDVLRWVFEQKDDVIDWPASKTIAGYLAHRAGREKK